MKFFAFVAAAVASVSAAGSYSITAYNTPSCTNGTVFETLSGTTNSTCVSFPGGRSLNLVMTGSCARMTAFFGSNCVAGVGPSPDQTDIGSPWSAGCQTFALNGGQTSSFNSFQVFC
ncbi:hypothetical protein MKEN_00273500 [Mycena kentingensis (nom. inval.)]|nr:hypothetical protein MKEN_00273500 [Mycena kentingensis (nom. inval.)]